MTSFQFQITRREAKRKEIWSESNKLDAYVLNSLQIVGFNLAMTCIVGSKTATNHGHIERA